ncbi:flagellin [Verrucomicrobia bacterium]|nr:flagellin [Verrucomicrobiota bacterium]
MVIINSNNSSAMSARVLGESTQALQKSLARLSSGSKLNSAADDAAGAAVSLKLDSQVSRLNAAKSNVGNAISYGQTQDSYLKKVGTALDRMGELAVLAQDTTKSSTDLGLYDKEFQKLATFIGGTNQNGTGGVATKEFNGVDLFSNGSAAIKVTQDEDGTAYTTSAINFTDAKYTNALGAELTDTTKAATALTNVKAAITQLADDRANVGADQSVLQNISSTMSVLKDNLGAANSRIKDVDVAEESANFARQNILVQSGTAMLAQANALPQSALRLIG